MRNNLILHFHCSECGARLALCYDDKDVKEVKTPPPRLRDNMDKEPTGADCYYPSPISVKPCQQCINKYTLPAKKLLEGFKAMESI